MTDDSTSTNCTITFICIATNSYVVYADKLIESIHRVAGIDQFEFILLTDKEDYAPKREIPNFTKIIISSLGWPWATLMRYHLISNYISIAKSDNVCYIDADSIVHYPFWKNLSMNDLQNGVAMVRHPGFYRSQRIKLYLSNYRFLLRDLKLICFEGGLGNWERRKNSTAHVPFLQRRDYVCGGLWLGKKEDILKMCNNLQKNVDLDLSINLIARWHDESHLNAYKIKKEVTILGPEYCNSIGLQNLVDLDVYVEAITK
jgi:hypothetical protein